MKLKIIKRPAAWDSNDIYWIIDGESCGAGYQGKSDSRYHVVRCPLCSRENYGPVVAEGYCCWCNFNPNKEKYEEIL